ncbi:MAG: GH92 family glycosyl hydrolase [Cyclobacteriaceae bacterium]|nr:GH92 family glycosyl hydrolase [Cyclobacteriaceae bacterium]
MKKNFLLVCLFSSLFTCSVKDEIPDFRPLTYVNTQIGAIGHMLEPTAELVHMPHAMLRVYPLRSPGVVDAYTSSRFYGFPLNVPAHREGSIGRVMPYILHDKTEINHLFSEYDHDFTTSTPYYYGLQLEDFDIHAGIATSERSAIMQFRFPELSEPYILIQTPGDGYLELMENGAIQGYEMRFGMKHYFYILPDQSFTIEEASPQNGKNASMRLKFSETPNPIHLRYGISFIDEKQARINLDKEVVNNDFEDVKRNAEKAWNTHLAGIEVEGADDDTKTVFYTALYRTSERMINISEDGRYFSAYDGKVHNDQGIPFYVDDWLWDTYRTSHPLCALWMPGQMEHRVHSFIRMYEQSGWIPTFPMVYGDRGAMIGHHQAALISDAWFKGIRNFDVEKAYEALKKNAMEGTMIPWQTGPATEIDEFYREYGYFPAIGPDEKEFIPQVNAFEQRQAVAVTLEHAYDDWCLANLADALGKKEDADYFYQRAHNYRNVFNPETGFMAPKRADGTWVEPFDPRFGHGIGSRAYFAEVNGWNYLWHVQHDPAGLIQLLGGEKYASKKLDQMFNEPLGMGKWMFKGRFPDATGITGQFVMGDEPGFHVPYLYVYNGEPWKTQKRIRMLMDTWFTNSLLGICGDEDGGAMSAWYVFSAMGFYPFCPGSPYYLIGSPQFEKVIIHLDKSKKFTIEAKNVSRQNKYVQSARLNGHSLERAWFLHSEIAEGGNLILDMGPKPNKNWASDPMQKPPSFKLP